MLINKFAENLEKTLDKPPIPVVQYAKKEEKRRNSHEPLYSNADEYGYDVRHEHDDVPYVVLP